MIWINKECLETIHEDGKFTFFFYDKDSFIFPMIQIYVLRGPSPNHLPILFPCISCSLFVQRYNNRIVILKSIFKVQSLNFLNL